MDEEEMKWFREYAETVFPYRKDRMWDNVDDWIKYGDMFLDLKLKVPTNESGSEQV